MPKKKDTERKKKTTPQHKSSTWVIIIAQAATNAMLVKAIVTMIQIANPVLSVAKEVTSRSFLALQAMKNLKEGMQIVDIKTAQLTKTVTVITATIQIST